MPARSRKKSGSRKTSSARKKSTARRAAPARLKARDLERTYSRSQFVAKLRRLDDALETRRAFIIQVAGERLHISAQAEFNIEHERAGGEHELEFQLRWRD